MSDKTQQGAGRQWRVYMSDKTQQGAGRSPVRVRTMMPTPAKPKTS